MRSRYKADALLSLDKTEEAEAMMQLPEVKNYRKSLYKRLSHEQVKFNLANPCYVNPGDARTYNEKGVALFNSQNYEEAVACFKEAIKLKDMQKSANSVKVTLLEDAILPLFLT